jgi:hypothetical protein
LRETAAQSASSILMLSEVTEEVSRMRYLKILVIVAALAVFGIGVIQADEPSIPTFSDGRVNNWEIDAPIAVYCVFDHSEDVNVGVFQNIEVWGLNSEKLLEASAAQIDAASAGAVLASNWSYTLTKLTDDSFRVSAPNGYTFAWERGDEGC